MFLSLACIPLTIDRLLLLAENKTFIIKLLLQLCNGMVTISLILSLCNENLELWQGKIISALKSEI